jgi:hypothetical protein
MVFLFAVTIFLGSALLFLIQPMFARMVLPVLGGSPSVWNTAMVFYQAVLLAGYAYAHLSTSRLGARRQSMVHLSLLLLPFAVLPVALAGIGAPPTDSSPIWWLLGTMTVAVGLPFFAAATMGPTLQAWFAFSGHPRAADPYFLYSASNLGSMLALLGYPFAIEPFLTLTQQSQLWTWGYAAFVVLSAACVAAIRRGGATAAVTPANETAPPPGARRRARWVVLALVPSSLMLGVTAYLSSEVAVVPLLWVIPLALYLLTFVVAFSPVAGRLVPFATRAFAILAVTLVVAINMQATQPLGWLMLLHLVVFTLAAFLCHAKLANDRPAPSQLTQFYLWISVGGVCGGIFNALLAPLLFKTVVEYPLALILAAYVAGSAGGSSSSRARLFDWIAPVALGVFAFGLAFSGTAIRFLPMKTLAGAIFGLPALGCFFLSRRPLRFALGLAAMLLAATVYRGEGGTVLHTERSFFGLHRISLDPTLRVHHLVNGRTLHGTQSLDPARRQEPLAYYFRTGPAGQILTDLANDPAQPVGVVGLGAGSLAAYARPGQPWTFFEIDPAVVRLARDERYFSFLRDSPAKLRVVLGDARPSLQHEPDHGLHLLLVDAFSSDAIPAHLITREALALYLRKLAPHGVIAVHISNLHLDLEPVLSALAREAGLVCRVRDDTVVSDAERDLGKSASIWLVLARDAADLGPLAGDRRWLPARLTGQRVWTDNYSSILHAFRSR